METLGLKCQSWIRFIYQRQKHFKNVAGVDTPKFVRKVDLASLKSEIDKLDNGNEKLEIRY